MAVFLGTLPFGPGGHIRRQDRELLAGAGYQLGEVAMNRIIREERKGEGKEEIKMGIGGWFLRADAQKKKKGQPLGGE